jgi:hypothetical protein
VWARLYVLDQQRREAEDRENPGVPQDTPERWVAAAVIRDDPRFRFTSWGVAYRSRAEALAADEPYGLTHWAGDYERALDQWLALAEAAQHRGRLATVVAAWAGAISCAAAIGELARAEDLTARAWALAQDVQLWGPVALTLLGARDVLCTALDEGADDLIRDGAALTKRGGDVTVRWGIGTTYASLARIAALKEDERTALAFLELAADVTVTMPGWAITSSKTVGNAAAAAWYLPTTQYVDALETATIEKVLPGDFRSPMTDPRVTMAHLRGAAGDVEGARQWFAAARPELAVSRARTLRAMAVFDEALLLIRAGRAAEAQPYIETAGDRFERLGMRGWSRRLEALVAGQHP